MNTKLLKEIESELKNYEGTDREYGLRLIVNEITSLHKEINELRETIKSMRYYNSCHHFNYSGMSYLNKEKKYKITCRISNNCPCEKWEESKEIKNVR